MLQERNCWELDTNQSEEEGEETDVVNNAQEEMSDGQQFESGFVGG